LSPAQTSPDRYDELLHHADAAFRGKRLQEALATWREAWALKRSPFVACNIGRAERLVGSAREAADFLSLCLRLSAAPTTPDEKRRFGQFAADLKHVRGQVAALTIAASESGARIHIDDRLIGVSPLPGEVFVEPGEHRVTAILEGYDRAQMTIGVQPGEARTVSIVLTKPAPRPTMTAPPVLPLTHKAPPPAVSPGPSKLWLVPGISATTVALGLGTGLSIVRGEMTDTALASRQDVRLRLLNDCTLSDPDPSCSQYIAAEQTRSTMKSAAVASLVAGGLAAAATVVYVLFPGAPIAPSIGAGSGLKVSF
jgi:hypothetical protein